MNFGVAPFMETFILVQFFLRFRWIDGEDAAEGVRNSTLVEVWVIFFFGRSTVINPEFGEIDFLVGGSVGWLGTFFLFPK